MITHHRRRIGHLALSTLGLAVALLTGCAAPTGQPPMPNVPQAAPAPAPAAPPAPAGETSERGMLVKRVGQPAGFTNAAGAQIASFVVDKITVDGKCTAEYSTKPENGHFVILDVRAETMAALAPQDFLAITPHSFSVVGPDGVTESAIATGPAFTCVDAQEQFTVDQFTPSSKYRGKIVLDTAHTSGVIMYRPGFVDGGGWEWRFPA